MVSLDPFDDSSAGGRDGDGVETCDVCNLPLSKHGSGSIHDGKMDLYICPKTVQQGMGADFR